MVAATLHDSDILHDTPFQKKVQQRFFAGSWPGAEQIVLLPGAYAHVYPFGVIKKAMVRLRLLNRYFAAITRKA
jgi:hypothetical protein